MTQADDGIVEHMVAQIHLSDKGPKGQSDVSSGNQQAASEVPGQEPASLPLSDNAGIETKGAAADEASRNKRGDGDSVEGAASETVAADTTGTDKGVTTTGSGVSDSTADAGIATTRAATGAPDTGPAPGVVKVVGADVKDVLSEDTPTATIGSGEGGAADSSADVSGGEGGQVDRHEDVLHHQEAEGKIFHVEPVLPGGGITVHGMVPAAILMHTDQNTKRTGGSPHEATAGVEDTNVGGAVGVQSRLDVLDPDQPAPDANVGAEEAAGASTSPEGLTEAGDKDTTTATDSKETSSTSKGPIQLVKGLLGL